MEQPRGAAKGTGSVGACRAQTPFPGLAQCRDPGRCCLLPGSTSSCFLALFWVFSVPHPRWGLLPGWRVQSPQPGRPVNLLPPRHGDRGRARSPTDWHTGTEGWPGRSRGVTIFHPAREPAAGLRGRHHQLPRVQPGSCTRHRPAEPWVERVLRDCRRCSIPGSPSLPGRPGWALGCAFLPGALASGTGAAASLDPAGRCCARG